MHVRRERVHLQYPLARVGGFVCFPESLFKGYHFFSLGCSTQHVLETESLIYGSKKNQLLNLIVLPALKHPDRRVDSFSSGAFSGVPTYALPSFCGRARTLSPLRVLPDHHPGKELVCTPALPHSGWRCSTETQVLALLWSTLGCTSCLSFR